MHARLTLAMMLAGSASIAPAQEGAVGEVLRLVDRFEAARTARDPNALATTLAPDCEEISPVGDVDSRAEVLGFYAPRPGGAMPAMTATERVATVVRDGAVVTTRLSFTPPAAGATLRSVRVRYVARRDRGGWKLVSAQYTAIPGAR